MSKLTLTTPPTQGLKATASTGRSEWVKADEKNSTKFTEKQRRKHRPTQKEALSNVKNQKSETGIRPKSRHTGLPKAVIRGDREEYEEIITAFEAQDKGMRFTHVERICQVGGAVNAPNEAQSSRQSDIIQWCRDNEVFAKMFKMTQADLLKSDKLNMIISVKFLRGVATTLPGFYKYMCACYGLNRIRENQNALVMVRKKGWERVSEADYQSYLNLRARIPQLQAEITKERENFERKVKGMKSKLSDINGMIQLLKIGSSGENTEQEFQQLTEDALLGSNFRSYDENDDVGELEERRSVSKSEESIGSDVEYG